MKLTCIRYDLEAHGPANYLQSSVSADREYTAYLQLYGDAFGTHDVIVFASVRGTAVANIRKLACERNYKLRRITVQDARDCVMIVCCPVDGISDSDIAICPVDLGRIYMDLRDRQQKQTKSSGAHMDIVIRDTSYKIDLRAYDFTVVPPALSGVFIWGALISQFPKLSTIPYTTPQQIRAMKLANIMYLDSKMPSVLCGGFTHIINVNVAPSDTDVFVLDRLPAKRVLDDICEEFSKPLNDGMMHRSTLLDRLSQELAALIGATSELDTDVQRQEECTLSCFTVALNCSEADASFGPRLDEFVADKLPALLHAPSFVASMRAIYKASGLASVWAGVIAHLRSNGVSERDLALLIYEEPHLRVQWRM